MVEVQPKQPTWKGPEEWFTGDVFIDGLAAAQGTESVTLARSTSRRARTPHGTGTRRARPCASPRARATCRPAADR